LELTEGNGSSVPSALLVCGFLGAGKTTFILEQIRSFGRRTAVLVNEFGDLGVDGTVIRSRGGLDVIELPGGCICCSMKDELAKSIRTVAEDIRPDVLLIEPSGVAEASEVIAVLTDKALSSAIRLDAVITIIDVSTFLDFSEPDAFGAFFLDQVTNADLIICNKTDLISLSERDQVARRIFELNPSALAVETSFCKVSTPLPSGRNKEIRFAGSFGPAMECVGIDAVEDISQNQLEKFTLALSGGELGKVYRAKGLVKVADGGCTNLQYSGGAVSLTPFAEQARSRIVLIGYDLDRKRIREFFE
jgi:G3E family GTPase